MSNPTIELRELQIINYRLPKRWFNGNIPFWDSSLLGSETLVSSFCVAKAPLPSIIISYPTKKSEAEEPERFLQNWVRYYWDFPNQKNSKN